VCIYEAHHIIHPLRFIDPMAAVLILVPIYFQTQAGKILLHAPSILQGNDVIIYCMSHENGCRFGPSRQWLQSHDVVVVDRVI
jgi:hypothetical protein